MKINSYKIKMAQKFLNQLKKEIAKIKTKEDLVLDMYANGREAGYHLSCYTFPGIGIVRSWGCSFSESRGSDQLVVYIGEGPFAFQMGGNIPNEDVYKNKKFYHGPTIKNAVADIVDSLLVFLIMVNEESKNAKV